MTGIFWKSQCSFALKIECSSISVFGKAQAMISKFHRIFWGLLREPNDRISCFDWVEFQLFQFAPQCVDGRSLEKNNQKCLL